MKWTFSISLISTAFFFLLTPLFAEEAPLKVGIVNYNPPFIIQGSQDKMYGYDIDMINTLCKLMQRTCKFQIIKRRELLKSVEEKEIDIAINNLTITVERLKTVNFSIPYLVSEFRFLSMDPEVFAQPFSINLLNNKKIGVPEGTIFTSPHQLGIEGASMVFYDSVALLIEALQDKKVDFVLLPNQVAVYWDANTPVDIRPVGPPFSFGLGIGIAVNKNNPALLQQINKALIQYQSSPVFKLNYDKYLKHY